MQPERNSKGQFIKGGGNYWKGKKRPEIQKWLKNVQFQKGHIPFNAGKPYLQIRGKNHHKWKGDEVGYGALHNWVELRLGKARFCANDKNHTSSVYYWANISGEYKRDLNDWDSLCPSCNKMDGISTKGIFDKKRHRIRRVN